MENISANPSNENILFPIDLSIFKEHVKLSFESILDSLPATQKTLVIEESCIKKIDFFFDFSLLEKKNVKKGVILLSRNALITDSPNIVYVISPNKKSLEDIYFQYQNQKNRDSSDFKERKESEKRFTVIFIPKINYDCQVFIEKNNLKADLNIQNLPIDMIPFDKEILSLEANDTIQELFVRNDTNILSVLSRVIIKFETVFGKIKHKYAKGDYSKILKKIVESEEDNSPFETDTEILSCIMLDRSVDFITPLCSQYTYEGMIDEFIGISYNSIKVKSEILAKDDKKDKKIEVSSKDKFFSKIRDFNFNYLRTYLPAKLDEHKMILSEGKKENKDLKVIADLVTKLTEVKEENPSVAIHINIADYISNNLKLPLFTEYLRYEQNLLVGGDVPNYLYEFYENEMAKQADINKILRLMCIESLIQNGLRSRVYDSIKRDFLNVYGFQEIYLLKNLEKLKILKKQEQKSSYEYINEENVNVMEPDDASYVFGGYCPITIRLIENVIKKGWNPIKEVIKKLPGDFEFPINEKEVYNPKGKCNFILLVFIGGITYAEISAIRFLNKTHKDYKFIILTTHIFNGKKFIEGLRQKFEAPLTLKDYHFQLKQFGFDK